MVWADITTSAIFFFSLYANHSIAEEIWILRSVIITLCMDKYCFWKQGTGKFTVCYVWC